MDQNELRRKIGQAIRTARIRRGLVMRDLAEASGVSTGAVGNWERGANAIEYALVAALIAIAGYAAFINLGTRITTMYSNVSNQLPSN